MGLARQLDLAGRLHVASAQSGRGRQIGRAELVLGESEQLTALAPRGAQCLTKCGGERREDVGRRLGRSIVPVRVRWYATEERLRVLRRARVPGSLFGPTYDVQDLRLVDVAARD